MNRNEPNALFRKTGNFPIYDVNGRLVSGLTFLTASGEVIYSGDGATPGAASANIVEVGRGLYTYVASQAETNTNVDFEIWAIKKAAMDLATKTTNCTSKIRAKLFGLPGNDYTMTWVQSAGVSPTTGTLVLTGTDYVFTYKDGVTTVGNFESLITASANLEVGAAGTSATLLHTVDQFGPVNLANGVEASIYQQIGSDITTSFAAIPAAVWNLAAVGSRTYGDLQRLAMAVLAGPVVDFTTNTLTFNCPVTGTTRLTVVRGAAGRVTCTIGTLSP